MVRKMSVLMIAVLLTMLLAGCQCQHEWGEADCINPQICGLCEATEGEALGHQYGPWEFAAETMSHSCEVCGEAETVPTDYGILMKTRLHGVWELRAFGEAMGHLLAEADGTGTLCDVLGEKQSFQAEYESHTLGETQVVYSGVLVTEDGGSAFTLYDNHEGADYLTVSIGDQEAEYFRNDALFSIPEGYWAYSDYGKLFYMELNQDRSFSADWGDGRFSGIWHASPEYTKGGEYRYTDITLQYPLDGKIGVETFVLECGKWTEDLEQYAADYHDPNKYIATSVTAVSVDGETLYYYEKTPKEYGKLHELTDIAAERIIGKWDTMYIRRGFDGPWEELSGYNITFLADGTFTSDLGGNHAGTWSYDFAAEYNFGTYYDLRYSDGTCVSVEITKTGFDLRVGESQYFIKCINEEMDNAVAEAHVVGEWLQFDGPVVDADTGAYSGKVVFNTDGSFVANLEEEIRGTWSVASVDTNPEAVRSQKEEILPEIYLEMMCSDPNWTIENPQILAEVYLYFELNGNGVSNDYMFQE